MKAKLGFVLVLILSVLASCKKTDTTKPALSGSWKISSLMVNGTDKASLVSQFTISFDDNGMMSIQDSVNTFNCNWSDDGMSNSEMHDFHFDMTDCPDGSPMHDLDAEWEMDSQADNACSFHDKNSSNDILSLEKI